MVSRVGEPPTPQTRSPRYSTILICGWSIIWFTRPYEAAILALSLALVLGAWLLSPRRRSTLQILLPILAGGILSATYTLYYNWRVTNNPFLLPYRLYQRIYSIPQNFIWQPPIRGPIPENQDLRANYLWQRATHDRAASLDHFPRDAAEKFSRVWSFYTNYFARGLPLLLLSCGLRELWHWRWRELRLGAVFAVLLVFMSLLQNLHIPDTVTTTWHLQRAAIQKTLEQTGPKHLIFIRYAPNHDFYQEWVYNSANINHSAVVWAHPLNPEQDAALMRYFKERKFWLLDVDESKPALVPLAKLDN